MFGMLYALLIQKAHNKNRYAHNERDRKRGGICNYNDKKDFH